MTTSGINQTAYIARCKTYSVKLVSYKLSIFQLRIIDDLCQTRTISTTAISWGFKTFSMFKFAHWKKLRIHKGKNFDSQRGRSKLGSLSLLLKEHPL